MKRRSKITVFGNELESKDRAAVRLVPELERRWLEARFELRDPTESLDAPTDPWIILDTAIGIDKVTIVTDLGDLEQVKGQSVHDFDVYMELRLKEKLGLLPKIRIVLVPEKAGKEVVPEVERQLRAAVEGKFQKM